MDPDASHGARPEQPPELLTVGSTRRGPPKWPIIAVLVVAAVVGVYVFTADGARDMQTAADRRTGPSASSRPSVSRGPHSPADMPAPGGGPVVNRVGKPLLGATADWDLFVFTPGELVRIEPAKGRISRTPVPPLMSSGPLAFLVDSDSVLIHPLDLVDGYEVPDGQPARRQTLPNGGRALPGPRPGQVWVDIHDSSTAGVAVQLMTLRGETLGRSITARWADPWPVVSDARGHLLVAGAGGAYVLRPDGPQRITTGSLAAVGPTAFLVVECDEAARCRRIVVDRAPGHRRSLGRTSAVRATEAVENAPGVVSPDGSMAAISRDAASSGTLQVELVDLATGDTRLFRLPAPPDRFAGTSLAWSPDGRWLFVAAHRFLAVDVRNGRVLDLGRRLGVSSVTQVAVRSAHPITAGAD